MQDRAQFAQWPTANHRRYLSTGLGIAGLATAGVAVWAYLRPPHAEKRGLAIAPLLDSDRGGLQVTLLY